MTAYRHETKVTGLWPPRLSPVRAEHHQQHRPKDEGAPDIAGDTERFPPPEECDHRRHHGLERCGDGRPGRFEIANADVIAKIGAVGAQCGDGDQGSPGSWAFRRKFHPREKGDRSDGQQVKKQIGRRVVCGKKLAENIVERIAETRRQTEEQGRPGDLNCAPSLDTQTTPMMVRANAISFERVSSSLKVNRAMRVTQAGAV